MRNPDGSYKTTGEAGFEQAEQINKIRKDRKDLQDAAKLKDIGERKERVKTEDDRDFQSKQLEKEYGLKMNESIAVQELQNTGAIDVAKIQFAPA